MNHWLKVIWAGLAFGGLVSGCHIENHDGDVTPDSRDECGDFCLRLYDCGSLSSDAFGACADQCTSKLQADPDRTVAGCDCVLDDECRALNDYQCPGAPIPISPGVGSGTNSAGNGDASDGGATSSSGGSTSSNGGATSSSGGSALGCQGGYDCAADEDCVDGACRQRCSASCQCPTDLSCVDHYCRSSTPPPMCTVDCECASGQHCVNGSCG